MFSGFKIEELKGTIDELILINEYNIPNGYTNELKECAYRLADALYSDGTDYRTTVHCASAAILKETMVLIHKACISERQPHAMRQIFKPAPVVEHYCKNKNADKSREMFKKTANSVLFDDIYRGIRNEILEIEHDTLRDTLR